MRRLALACAAVVAVLLLLLYGSRVARSRAPAIIAAAPPAERAWPGGNVGGAGGLDGAKAVAFVVELHAGGVVELDGQGVSLAALHRTCAGKETVSVRADDEVPWCHVELVLAALQGAGVRRIRFEFPDGVIESCFDSDYWKQDARHVVGGHTSGLITLVSNELYDSGVERRVAAEASRIASECRLRPLGEVVAYVETEWPSFGIMARGLRALRDAGVEIEFRYNFWVDGNVPSDTPLPPPTDLPCSFIDAWPRCACRPGIAAVDFPAADMGEADKEQEEDDRLIVNLDRDGRIFWRKALSLDELALALEAAKDRYHVKMKQKGETGLDEDADGAPLSKLYVLIRADRAASPRQVGFLLHVLAEEGFYKVQFAVVREAPTEVLPCVETLASKIRLLLPTDEAPGISGAVEPSVHVYVDPAAFGVGARGGLDAEGFCRAVREAAARRDPDRKFVVGVHVAPGAAWERVIAAVNEVARAGFGRIVFVDLPPPDAATRRMTPLPR